MTLRGSRVASLWDGFKKQRFKGMLSYCQRLIQLFPIITQTVGGKFDEHCGR
jgi:hypothetical protein